jgi:hypothetical protein
VPSIDRAFEVAGRLTLVSLVACGSVAERPPPDAASDAPVDGAPDAWPMSCASPAEITPVEAAETGYGNACIHGNWQLQSPNGVTVPSTASSADHTIPVVPTPIGATQHPNLLDPSSKYAISVSGVGQKNEIGGIGFSYAQLSATLNTLSATQVGSVDASAFTGLEFDAIINAPSGARVSLANKYTDPSGHLCDPHPAQPMKSCFDNPSLVLAPSTAWTHYQIPFKALTQLGFGFPSPTGDQFPASEIINVRWDIDIPSDNTETPAWELWIDNLRFYP